jgi:regulator of protease activity HflC (stomatin/prohibitin superfamily)
MSHRTIIDASTGEIVNRELTAAELSQQETDAIAEAERNAAIAAKEAARQSGIDKLTALGLTVDEVSAVFGV